MADGLCATHKAAGRLVPAFYKVNGEGICKSCYDGKPINIPGTKPTIRLATQAVSQEGTVTMQKQVDWTAVQNERTSGVKAKEICKKYGIAQWELYYRTKSNGKRPAGGGQKFEGSRASLAQWRQRDAA
jgi:hypothetical protein